MARLWTSSADHNDEPKDEKRRHPMDDASLDWLGPKPSRFTLRAGEARGDRVERAGHARAEQANGRDDDNGDEGGNQAVLDCGGAILVIDELDHIELRYA